MPSAKNINLKAEQEFENSKIRQGNKHARSKQEKYYAVVKNEIQTFEEIIKSKCHEKRVLEIGSSDGSLAFATMQNARSYIGLDISDLAVDNANKFANQKELNTFKFTVGDAHNLSFPDDDFDVVVAISILHHLDLERTLPEIRRVLKSEGVLISREPLDANPLFNFYRRLTPSSRTADELPLTDQDLKILLDNFNIKYIRYFGLLSLLSAFLGKTYTSRVVNKLLRSIDLFLEKTALKKYFWQVNIIATPKKTHD
ncbi:class I SAM-dependent methyltransferase [Planktomarina temperata]|nr:class I SAM-dependent methyltransferase [Planktomarina temperata]